MSLHGLRATARLPLLPASALVLFGVLFGGMACNGVLGITTASVDPALLDASSEAEADAPSDTGPSADADAGVDPFSCAAYCSEIMRVCAGVDQEYISEGVCLRMCATFEPGRPGEQQNDSLACRISHLKPAASDPAAHCKQAGPLGAGACATDPCAPFCALTYSLCNGLGLFPFDGGVSACRSDCSTFAYQTDAGDLLLSTGNTLNCRTYHIESAYEVGNPVAPTTHCPHTARESATCN